MSKKQLTLFELEEDADKTKYTKPTTDGKVDYIEREVDRFDFDGYQVVRKEFSQKQIVQQLHSSMVQSFLM